MCDLGVNWTAIRIAIAITYLPKAGYIENQNTKLQLVPYYLPSPGLIIDCRSLFYLRSSFVIPSFVIPSSRRSSVVVSSSRRSSFRHSVASSFRHPVGHRHVIPSVLVRRFVVRRSVVPSVVIPSVVIPSFRHPLVSSFQFLIISG